MKCVNIDLLNGLCAVPAVCWGSLQITLLAPEPHNGHSGIATAQHTHKHTHNQTHTHTHTPKRTPTHTQHPLHFGIWQR